MDRTAVISRREALWLAAASLVFAAAFLYPTLSPVGELGSSLANWITRPLAYDHLLRLPSNGDADLFTELRWVPYWTVVHFHQLPFWNPYKCGGMGMLSNPESAIVTPFFLLYLMFGMVAGIDLDIYLHLAIMFAGGYYLGRMLGLNRIAATVCAVVFPASSWFYLHLSVGHLNFLPGAYLPWIAALLFESIESNKFFPAVIGGLLAALTLTEGNYTFLYTTIVIAMVAVILSLIKRSPRPFLSGAVIGLFGLGFAALRLIPMSQQLAIYPKHPFGIEPISMQLIRSFLLSPDQDLFRPRIGFEFAWCEYGAYISLAFLFLAAVGLVARPVKSLPWVLPAIVFILFARGWTGQHSFVFILLYLPMGSSTGLTGRYLIPFVFCVGVIAAYGADYLCANLRPRGVYLAVTLLIIGTIDSWIVGAPNARYLFMYPIQRAPYSASFRQFWTLNTGMMTEINLANMASVNCQGYGYNDIPENPRGYNQSGYRGEYYLLGGGTVNQRLWTPNRLRYDVDLPGPTSLIVNQNAYPGWHSIGDGELYSDGGLIGIRLPAGRHSIELIYVPDRILLALLITLVTISAAIVIWKLEKTA
ncbi:MAG TPA: hypothetical protein VMA09_09055 [Candidatus Binataceae bacterium]|nr:hypothetical protein [Candidatus Binataceae bacterium]